jgi:CRISPR/Cas system endoribonuclease Cas6 (RAMP superfamily)
MTTESQQLLLFQKLTLRSSFIALLQSVEEKLACYLMTSRRLKFFQRSLQGQAVDFAKVADQ